METFSASPSICEGNQPVLPADFPHKGQWRGALMFSLTRAWKKKQLSKQSKGRWYEPLSLSLWRRCNDGSKVFIKLPGIANAKAAEDLVKRGASAAVVLTKVIRNNP